jgi:cytochrome c-type protein NapB
MNRIVLLIVLIALTPIGQADEPIPADEMGLEKSSVFDVPVPASFSYNESFPGTVENLPESFPGAPPQIPHTIDLFLPVTRENNLCLGCHDYQQFRDQKEKVLTTPMPASHYTDLRSAPDKIAQQVEGARYVCTQCHVPQAEVKPLVENSFQGLTD